jgi:hypothetical protein
LCQLTGIDKDNMHRPPPPEASTPRKPIDQRRSRVRAGIVMENWVEVSTLCMHPASGTVCDSIGGFL